MPTVSIIIPIYNGQDYIKNCLDSILEQTYEDFEIVIINDGSTDDTKAILEKYQKRYEKKIMVYEKPNTGVADTRNVGIQKANGKYILFVDMDDYIKEDLLEKLQPYMDQDIDMIKFKMVKTNEEKEILEKIDGPVFKITTGEDAFNQLFGEDVLIDSPCIYLIKRELIRQKGFKFTLNTYHEDFGLIPLIIINAKTFASCNVYGYYYIQTQNSITRNLEYEKTIKKAFDLFTHYDNMIKQIETYNISGLTKQNVKKFYTNTIILKTNELERKDQKQYIYEIKKRKIIQNIKITNVKQLFKKILLIIDIRLYLKLR